MPEQWISDENDCIYCERRHHTEVNCNTILLKEIAIMLARGMNFRLYAIQIELQELSRKLNDRLS